MQRFRSITIVCVLVALCCFSQPAPESKAENRVVYAGVIAEPIRLAKRLPGTGGIRLAQSGKRGQAQGGGENWKRMGETVVSGGDEPTKVKIRGNTVLVPVTLAYGGYEVNVHLVLDTGASKTTISTEIAEQLNLDRAGQKKRGCRLPGGLSSRPAWSK